MLNLFQHLILFLLSARASFIPVHRSRFSDGLLIHLRPSRHTQKFASFLGAGNKVNAVFSESKECIFPRIPQTKSTLPIPVSLAPMVGLGLGKLDGLEPSDILVEPMFLTDPLQFFYLRNDLVQNIPVSDNA